MTKPRWQLALEELALRYRSEAAARRKATPLDPAADALDYAAGLAEEQTAALLAPTRMLTPAQYAAEQEPPVDESTVRRWCAQGQLENEKDGKSYRIPAGAKRVRPDVALVRDVPLQQVS